MDRILDKFVNSEYFSDVLDKYRPLAVFVTGSRAAKIDNRFSDYDICVLVRPNEGGKSSNPDDFLQFIHKETGLCVHYFIRELNELFLNHEKGRDDSRQSSALWKALIEFAFSKNVLYLSEEFKCGWDTITENQGVIVKSSLYDIYKLGGYGTFMMESAVLGELHPHRDIVYLLLETFIYSDSTPTIEQLNRFKEIRKMTQSEVASISDEEKAAYISDIKNLVDYLQQNAFLLEKYLEDADSIYNSLVESLC
jgi:predicted nucleotidyltransferase